MKNKKEKQKEETAYVYLLLCSDGSYYCGYTTDPERRLKQHNAGQGAKYTRGRGPCQLVYTEKCASKGEALRRECALKRLTHEEKAALTEAQRKERMNDRAGYSL